jgi:hypothetical protein
MKYICNDKICVYVKNKEPCIVEAKSEYKPYNCLYNKDKNPEWKSETFPTWYILIQLKDRNESIKDIEDLTIYRALTEPKYINGEWFAAFPFSREPNPDITKLKTLNRNIYIVYSEDKDHMNIEVTKTLYIVQKVMLEKPKKPEPNTTYFWLEYDDRGNIDLMSRKDGYYCYEISINPTTMLYEKIGCGNLTEERK